MPKRSVFLIAVLVFLLQGGAFSGPVPAEAALQPVKIGVLAHRGAATALKMWSPTADYLTSSLPQYSFTIVPLGFHEIGPAVAQGEVDFVLANSSIYIELEARYGANRIATLRNDGWQGGHTVFGGVIFCRAERSDISALNDLQGKSFLAVDETSFGGWQVAWRELKNSGLDPYRDFASLRFIGTTHDDVVYAVRDGKGDAGTVRTDTLERLAAEGKIELSSFRILNPQQEKGFPFRLSTRLYPEWPLAAAGHTKSELAEQVVIALLNLPHDSPAARAGKNEGWTIPLNYQPVHELMQELRLGPYQDYGKITLAGVVRLYWHWLALAGAALLIMITLTGYVLKLNRRLLGAKLLVEEARNGLEQEVQERTADLQTANEGLTRSEERLNAAQRIAHIGSWELDLGTNVLLWSEENYRIFEIDPAGFGGSYEAFLEEIHPDDREAVDIAYKNSLSSRTPYAIEHRLLFPDGRIKHVHEQCETTYDADGRPLRSLGTVQDISERRQNEDELRSTMDKLRKSEKYVRDITASLGEGVYVLNALGNVTFMNPEAEKLLGWSEKELAQQNIHDIVHNRRGDGTPLLFADCEMRKVIETGNQYYSTAEMFVRKGGASFPVSVHSTPLLENGQVVASVTSFRDISARKQLEREREQLVAQLQQALADIKTLHGIVPICAACKKIRDDEGAWHQMEVYISKRTDAQFSHGICKDCANKLYPEIYGEDVGNRR